MPNLETETSVWGNAVHEAGFSVAEKLIAGEGVASAAHVQLRSTLRYSHANGELLTSFGQAFPKAPVHNFNEEDERKAACEHATKPLHTEEAPFTLPLEMRSR